MTYLEHARQKLSPPIYERFKKNCRNPHLRTHSPTWWLDAYDSFGWDDSTEGWNYWHNVLEDIRRRFT